MGSPRASTSTTPPANGRSPSARASAADSHRSGSRAPSAPTAVARDRVERLPVGSTGGAQSALRQPRPRSQRPGAPPPGRRHAGERPPRARACPRAAPGAGPAAQVGKCTCASVKPGRTQRPPRSTRSGLARAVRGYRHRPRCGLPRLRAPGPSGARAPWSERRRSREAHRGWYGAGMGRGEPVDLDALDAGDETTRSSRVTASRRRGRRRCRDHRRDRRRAPQAGGQDRRADRLEADRPGATGYTTAKVTSGHGAIYGDLDDRFGEEGARVYAESKQAALERIGAASSRTASSVTSSAGRTRLRRGAGGGRSARRRRSRPEAGLPASRSSKRRRCPTTSRARSKLENQAQFHPRKYLLALAETIPGDGSHVFEHTGRTT